MHARTPVSAPSIVPGSILAWRLLAPATVGAATGACVAAVSAAVGDWALDQLGALPGAIPALFSPLALLITWLVARHVTRTEGPATSELYILAYHQPEPRIPLRELPGRLLGAATTVAFGGSQGFESASALIGAAWGDRLARRAPPAESRRSLLAAGASAGIAAVFSSPAVGALYGIEVPFKRDVDSPRLEPCVIAAVCAYLIRVWLIGAKHLVPAPGSPRLDAALLLGCLAVALGCGLGARLFARAEEILRTLGRRQTTGARALIGGVVLAVLAFAGHAFSGAWITFGPGYIAAAWLLSGPHALWLLGLALAIRASGTLACVYGGGGGGVFTSLACNGAFVGQIVAVAIGRTETQVLPLLGAACFLGAGYRLPLACMLYVAEASGTVAVAVAGLVVVAVGQLLMGDASVSEAQIDQRPAAGPGGHSAAN